MTIATDIGEQESIYNGQFVNEGIRDITIAASHCLDATSSSTNSKHLSKGSKNLSLKIRKGEFCLKTGTNPPIVMTQIYKKLYFSKEAMLGQKRTH